MASVLETVGPRSGSAPLTYTLTELGTVDPQTVFAHLDGTAASGSFRPTLTIRSQNGAILARLFPTDELATGDTCDVTWSPFFRRSATTPATSTFAQVVAQLATTRDLRGYWRLGEGASPFADTSGNAGGPKDMTRVVQGTAMTLDYTPGALPPAQDDGAVKFNAATALVQGDVLVANAARFQLASDVSWTISAWIKPLLTTLQSHMPLGTYTPSTGGYSIDFGGATGLVGFTRADAGGSDTLVGPIVPLNVWSFVVCTYGLPSGESRIYVDGTLVASHSVVQAMAGLSNVRLGGNGSGGPAYNSFNGGVDEATVWGQALTAAEVAQLATAGGL